MSDLSEKFAELEATITALSETTDSYIDTTEAKLQAIFDELDLILVNNAANTRALLAAIGQNSPCAPCPTPPIVIPPIGTTPLAVNEEACKRAQAFLNFMDQVFTVLDLASSVGIGFNPALITDAVNQVIASLTGADSPDPISFPEAVQLVGDLVSYIATNLLVGHTLVGQFTPLYADLRDALATAGSAGAAKDQYDSIVSGSSLSSEEQAVIIDAAYGAAYTYFFDPDSLPDLAGLDGTLCGFVDCTTLSSASSNISGTVIHALVWTSPFTAVADDGSGTTSDHNNWTTDDIDFYTVTPTHTVRFFYGGGGHSDLSAGVPWVVDMHTTHAAMVVTGANVAFTVEICPP